MNTPSYRDFVRPGHPLVAELTGTSRDGALALEGAVAALRRSCAYVSLPGLHGFDELARRRASSPSGRLAVNCHGLSCLLASHLRAAGTPPDQVFAALGWRRDYPPGSGARELHAWTLLKTGGRLVWIDPATLRPETVTGSALLERHHLLVLFNDERLAVFPREKERVLLGDGAAGPRLYVYGRSNPGLRAALQRPGVRAGLRDFFDPAATPFEGDTGSADAAVAWGLARRTGGGHEPGPRVVLVSREAARVLRGLMEPALERYLAIAAETTARLVTAYARCAVARAYDWPEVSHIVVAGMFLDLAVGARLGLASDVCRDHEGTVVWAFEALDAGNGFGVQWSGSPGGRQGLGQLWHQAVPRPPVRLTPAMVALLHGLGPASPMAESGDWLYLERTGFVRRSAGGAQAGLPRFAEADAEQLLGPLVEGARRMESETIVPTLERAARHPAWRRPGEHGSLRQVVTRLVLEHGTDRVVDAGLLQPFPNGAEAPPGWGRWLWEEPARGLALMPRGGAGLGRGAVAS